jgi:hypothetical protein
MAHVTRRLPPSIGTQRRGVPESRRSAGRLVGVAGWSLAMMGGCAPEDELPLPPVVWEGESVRVRMDDPEIEVCGGSFEALDRHAELVRDALLLDGDGVIEYSIGDQGFVDERCTDSPNACTKTTTGAVFVSEPFILHEIVHAVRILDPHISLRSSPIEEGLATLFGSDDLGEGTVSLDAIGILEDTNVIGASEYYRAGYLMALLLERHGTEQLRTFDLLGREHPEDQAFAEAFGESATDFATVANGVPLCEQSQWWAPLLECDGEPIAVDPATDGFSFTGNLGCEEDRTLGPRRGRMWTFWHFRLDEPVGPLGYMFDFPEDATLEIVSCDMSCPLRFAYSGGRYDVGAVDGGLPRLEPGEYFLRLSRPVSNEDGEFDIVLE